MIKNMIKNFFIKNDKFKYLFFSVLSGILLSLSFQKFNIFILAWVSLIPLIHCIIKNDIKNSIILGFITGFVCDVIYLYWMFPFLLLNTNKIFDSFVVAMLTWLYFSLYFLVWAAALNYSKNFFNSKILISVFASFVWIILEYAKTYLFTGLPWNFISYSQALCTPIIQIVDIAGVYGLSFVIILINMLLYFWWAGKRLKYLIYSVLIVLSLLFYGSMKMSEFDSDYGIKKITAGIVQPNVDQYKKWDDSFRTEIVNSLYENAKYFTNKNVDIIVYPETVLPGFLQKDVLIKELIKKICPFAKVSLVGGMSIKFSAIKYNSVFVISREGIIIDKYNKKHLIIFGEYIPFEFVLSKLLTNLNTTGSIKKEEKIEVVSFQDYIFGINICSENYYPYLSRRLVLKGANILTNHTNDAWFGQMATPYQHFIINIFRAVENRKNVIVSANTGISGVIDSGGRIITKTKVGENINFVAAVYTNNYITIYDKIGDMFVYMCMFLSVICLLLPWFIKTKRQI